MPKTSRPARCVASGAFELTSSFVHLADGGGAEPIALTQSFWGGAAGARCDRVLGAFEFRSPRDLHSEMQEIHPEADEVLFLASGALDVLLEEDGAERAIALEAGQAAIVPRGVWHRLVMRRPGTLVFVNNRGAMQSRRGGAGAEGDRT